MSLSPVNTNPALELSTEDQFELDPSKLALFLKKKIGAGSFGVVYQGTYDGKDVAVKILSSFLDDQEEETQKELKMLKYFYCF